jgi:uncharacterized protein (TIGR00162 family)
MDSWKLKLKKDFSCNKPVFIEGLPGIGNVGKVVIDYIIDKLKAKKVGSLFSYDLPHSVFVNDKGLIQLPSIELYYLNHAGVDYLFLTGDAQPSLERASYSLSEKIITVLSSFDTKEIITLGGIGLDDIPQVPQVYVTGNKKSFVKDISSYGANSKIFGVVGPIVGVSGLLLGLSRKIPAAALLVETFGHPMYIGLKEAKVILELLEKKYSFNIDFKDLDDEIIAVDEEIAESQQGTKEKSKKRKYGKTGYNKDLHYIG